ncbi:MAG: coproporphyrinogen-III oxidase family protein [Myxococcota bacterium]
MDARELIDAARGRLDDFRELQAAGLIHDRGTFFPAGIHYPPITMYPPAGEREFLDGWKDPENGTYTFYLHVPFCKRQCTFCHYPIVTGKDEDAQARVVRLLGREMDIWLDRLGLDRIKARSALIAGGTPTHLSVANFRRLHEEIAKRVDLDPCVQLTYDVHPTDLVGEEGREKLAIMRDYGATRLTLGVQAMHDEILKHMNRGNSQDLAKEAMDECRRAGFEDLCVEFIFGYPGQDLQIWQETLERAVELDADEIQFYRLKIIPYGQGEGPVETMYEKKRERFVPTEEQILMKQMAVLFMNAHGFHENLVRVFTKTPHYTSHYTTDQCCKLLDTVGVGPSAFTSFRDRFCIHEPDTERWAALVEEGTLPVYRAMVRDRDAQLRWNLVLPLKNSEVYKDFYEERTGERVERVFARELDALKAYGLATEDATQVRLTRKGKFFADEICTQLGHPDYLPHEEGGFADGPLKLSRPLDPPSVAAK